MKTTSNLDVITPLDAAIERTRSWRIALGRAERALVQARAYLRHIEETPQPASPIQDCLQDGHTMKPERERAVEEIIAAYKAGRPSTSGRDCLEHVRQLGLKICNEVFWKLWREVRPSCH
jgi:hypothetical protein